MLGDALEWLLDAVIPVELRRGSFPELWWPFASVPPPEALTNSVDRPLKLHRGRHGPWRGVPDLCPEDARHEDMTTPNAVTKYLREDEQSADRDGLFTKTMEVVSRCSKDRTARSSGFGIHGRSRIDSGVPGDNESTADPMGGRPEGCAQARVFASFVKQLDTPTMRFVTSTPKSDYELPSIRGIISLVI
mmetsp:Transcript_87670/g.246274  ORF Transcript_87670/g.246274 Transcript_87670/m.246274 type:complete len:190 (-) Transcript_87670:30-599(-)